ncbi:MAG: hypothetical protein KIT25_06325 [Enhydrobacter sp.]|nr:MAG: hypothetical protein KIT25_06325 [Enhydrobacter sp.]
MGAAVPVISIASTLIGTGLGIASQSQQANARAAEANYRAEVARRQQEIAERNARLVEQRGAVELDRSRLETASLMGSQRARLAAQGGDVNSGTALDILGDTARAGAFDARTIRSNTDWNAWRHRLQADDALSSASAHRVQAANALAGLPYGIGSSLLGGASSLATKWDRFRHLLE